MLKTALPFSLLFPPFPYPPQLARLSRQLSRAFTESVQPSLRVRAASEWNWLTRPVPLLFPQSRQFLVGSKTMKFSTAAFSLLALPAALAHFTLD